MLNVFRKINGFFSGKSRPASQENADYPTVTDTVFNNYSFVIGSLFSYFNELPKHLKYRFVSRVHEYKQSKNFHFIGLEKNEDSTILVSASAIQVTFGLKNYRMQHFSDIYILADAYRMDDDEELYIGHVAPEGIYLSWKHFLYGYTHKGSNVNVAVHEMSHALLYNNFFAPFGGIDKNFRLNYERFSSTTGPIFADVITKRRSFLRSYAFSNLHEFWAVSTEAFFEDPRGLKEHMPDLYEALCRVLNQDPMTRHKILEM
jgi:hypothetical protein